MLLALINNPVAWTVMAIIGAVLIIFLLAFFISITIIYVHEKRRQKKILKDQEKEEILDAFQSAQINTENNKKEK